MAKSAVRSTIWKYVLDKPITTIEVPANSKVLYLGVQYNLLALWILVPLGNAKKVKRTFRNYLTGTGSLDDTESLVYIGTAILDRGSFVAHVFEDTS